MVATADATNRTYAPGYDKPVTRLLSSRTAESHAAFLLPGLHAGMRLLDCGCGPGTISVGLAERIAPGKFVGIDVGAEHVAMARALAAERALGNAWFEVADVYALPFPDESFDVVFGNALIDWLVEPLLALAEIRRVLKLGGLVALACADVDGHIHWPQHPLDEMWRLIAGVVQFSTGRRWNGSELSGLLLAAGFPARTMSARYEMLSPDEFSASNLAFINGPARDRIFAAGLCDAATLDRLQEEVQRFCATPGILMAFAWVEALARK